MKYTWDEVIADWAAWLDELERALDTDDWAAISAAGEFTPPSEAPVEPGPGVSAKVAARVAVLERRTDELKERLRAALGNASEEMAEHRRRSAVARRYLADGG